MNPEPKQLSLPAPDMSRWVFYVNKVKRPATVVIDILPPIDIQKLLDEAERIFNDRYKDYFSNQDGL
jgi:hypothetical protein